MGNLFGGGTPAKSDSVIKAEDRQKKDMARLDKQEASQMAAMRRKRGGRASLISGNESGVTSLLG